MPGLSSADHRVSPPLIEIPRDYNAAHDLIERNLRAGRGAKVAYVDDHGRVKIGDFGLSRSLTISSHLTRTGGFVGTPLFASPEQLKGERLDARTDIYSVAATLYYLLTGRAPFQHADGASVIARVVSEPAPPPRSLKPDIPPALEQVVMRGLERQLHNLRVCESAAVGDR